jgi:asparagine synthase (glutamine-hydrolysing)
MCGIFAYISSNPISETQSEQLKNEFDKIKYRGPDDTKWVLVYKNLVLGFHRLAINGLGHENDDPLKLGKSLLICNGEIYNYKKLQATYNFKFNTQNDCEVILHMYELFRDNVSELFRQLDGVFSFILIDTEFHKIYIANDPIGIRPLYNVVAPMSGYAFASEPIALNWTQNQEIYKHSHFKRKRETNTSFDSTSKIEFFPPGHYLEIKYTTDYDDNLCLPDAVSSPIRYYHYQYPINNFYTIEQIFETYRMLLTQAVHKRLISDRKIGCLLSGGLDSSLITAITAREFLQQGKTLDTFSIGLKGSPDLMYARKVSEFYNTNHHEVVVTESQFLECIPEVIRAIQSYDITTVRASCGNYLLGKYIKENTDCVVILNGDVSEEIHASYFYSRMAPNNHEFNKDNIRLLKEVHQYDVLRSARSMESTSLEARTPFADKHLVSFVMSIDPKLKRHNEKIIEKCLIRESFVGYLPDEVLFREKTAFSDGVSQKRRSWHEIIRDFVEKQVSDEEFTTKSQLFFHNRPHTKEAYYYRKCFETVLPGQGHLVQEYWMPRFIDGVTDPSARVLEDKKDKK